MSRLFRLFGYFSAGVGISIILGYWLRQEEARTRERLLLQRVPASDQASEDNVIRAQPTPNPVSQSDDLTQIRGIGAKTAGALNAAGILTFSALAGANAGDLFEKLRSSVRGLSHEKVSTWILEARENHT